MAARTQFIKTALAVLVAALLLGAFYVIWRQAGDKPEPQTSPGLSVEDFRLSGVGPDSAPAEIRRVFGAPLEKRNESEPSFHNPDYVVHYQTWIYPEAEIVFFQSVEKGRPVPDDPGRVISVLIKGGSFRTRRGIGIGDPLNKVYKEYGKTAISEGACWYENGLDYISFRIDDRKRVSAFEIGFMFD